MARRTFSVILAKRADIMILLHVEFLARVSPAAARRFIAEFKTVKTRLVDDPYQFPFADELDAMGIDCESYRKCFFFGRYKALFLIDGNDVFIDAIIDCRQDNSELF